MLLNGSTSILFKHVSIDIHVILDPGIPGSELANIAYSFRVIRIASTGVATTSAAAAGIASTAA